MDAVTVVTYEAELESNSAQALAPMLASTSASSSVPSSASASRQPSPKLHSSRQKIGPESQGPAIHRLPDEIIQQIITAADPNTFASLSLLNRRWHRISQQASLYALKLSQCLSFVASHESFCPHSARADDLPRLRRLFALQAKQNLFDAYLRPSITEIKLISTTFGSASAPAGEGLQFCPSPQGHHILAYNSSRIYVIDVRNRDAKVVRELATLRRPRSACIKDDGTLLAVLSTESQIDIYDLTQSPPSRKQSLFPDNPPRTIALSPCGAILATAYEGGIEVLDLHSDALVTGRRAVKCDTVDSLAFSFDGIQILGTTLNSNSAPPSTVVITAPYYDPNTSTEGSSSSLWTTSILFPNTSRDCSHSVLIQHTSQDEAAYAFTYDRNFETFRAVRVDDLRSSTTYFTGPLPHHQPNADAKIMPCTIPAATYYGDLVSSGFSCRDVWVYGVPDDLDAIPRFLSKTQAQDRPGGSLGSKNSSVSNRSSPGPASQVPQWQKLFDKHPNPNTFVRGFKIAELQGVSNVKFVQGFGGPNRIQERLVIAARSATVDIDKDDVNFVDGGRIMLVDFDYSMNNGVTKHIEIELGPLEAEVLEEEVRDLDTEVDIVRRRTVARNNGGARSSLLRISTTPATLGSTQVSPTFLSAPLIEASLQDIADDDDDPLVPRRLNASAMSLSRVASPHINNTLSFDADLWEALDAPYSHQNPRSTNTLRRAATAADASRRLRAATTPRVTYRRANGRYEHPHESDADNWVPPPPPYHKDDPGSVPNFMRQPAITPLPSGSHTQSPSSDALNLPTIEGGNTPSTAARSSPTVASMSTISPIALSQPQIAAVTSVEHIVDDTTPVQHLQLSQFAGGQSLTGRRTSTPTTMDEARMAPRTDISGTSYPSPRSASTPGLRNSQSRQLHDTERGITQGPRLMGVRMSLDEGSMRPYSSPENRPFGSRHSLNSGPFGRALSQDGRLFGPRLSLDERFVSTSDPFRGQPHSSRRSVDARSMFPPIVTRHRPAIPSSGTRAVSITSQTRSVSMPEPRSSIPPQSPPMPIGSSTFSPGGSDDYDPPAVWMTPRPGTSSFATFTETPDARQPLDNQAMLGEISTLSFPSHPLTSLRRTVLPYLNVDSSQFKIPRVPVASRSRVEPPRSWSTILPPLPPYSHSSHSPHSRSYSGNLPISSSSTSMQFTVMSDMPLMSTSTPTGNLIVPDTPLLISTPSGITGGADSTGPSDVQPRPEMRIHAPVAHRPRPSGRRGVARRLEDSLESRNSSSSSRDLAPLPVFPPIPGQSEQMNSASARHLSTWLTSSSKLRNKSATAIRRTRSNASRASRSAAINVRGLKHNKQKEQKKTLSTASTAGARRKKKSRDGDDGSVGTWTDITREFTPWVGVSASDRDGKKCLVM
ncbi:hypothetical protein Cpir12675_002074 [Ceratocystis pirilliformis]|uniref:F-box domain-containing protein n=1 Tax=Ceratocystis pirilliformis TaxID=259994 RepID=A0ABR3ZBK7_9PEZI